MHILRQEEVWQPKVITCSGLKGQGLEEIWSEANDFYQVMGKNNNLIDKRSMQLELWVWELLMDKIQTSLKKDASIHKALQKDLSKIKKHEATVLDIVDELYEDILGKS